MQEEAAPLTEWKGLFGHIAKFTDLYRMHLSACVAIRRDSLKQQLFHILISDKNLYGVKFN